VVGETRISVTRDNHVFQLEGLIVENLDVEVFAGTPFMEVNDIAICPAKRLITVAMAPLSYTAPTTITLLSKPPTVPWSSVLQRLQQPFGLGNSLSSNSQMTFHPTPFMPLSHASPVHKSG